MKKNIFHCVGFQMAVALLSVYHSLNMLPTMVFAQGNSNRLGVVPTSSEHGGDDSHLPPSHSSLDQRQYVQSLFNTALQHTKRGDELMALGNIDEAIAQYRYSLFYTDGSQSRARLGKALTVKGQLPEALKEYKRAIADTDMPPMDIALDMALLLSRMGRIEEAITMYRVGVRLPRPSKKSFIGSAPVTHTGEATSGSARGEISVAAVAGTKTVLDDPDIALRYEKRLAKQKGDNSPSMFEVPFSPLYFDSRLFEGAVRTALGRAYWGWPKMMVEFDRAVELAPTFAPAFLFRGDALQSEGKFKEAREMYKKALSLTQEGSPVAERAIHGLKSQ